MTSLEILLILIGVGILIFSCFLVDKSTSRDKIFNTTDSERSRLPYNQKLTERQLDIDENDTIRKKIETIISESSEDIVDKVDNILSQISNEKIIAVNDFSNQILAKISQNHEEVVFLYNMLNEKENEMKDTIKQADALKNQILEVQPKVKTKEKAKPSKKKQPELDLIENNQLNIAEEKVPDNTSENNNTKIIDLYKQGKTIIEISKILDIGQGEVKLVIDLYQNKGLEA